jgi:hypothetical protein
MRCIWCGREIPDGEIKEHIAQEHLGMHFTDGEKPADIDPSPEQPTEAKQPPQTPPLPLEKTPAPICPMPAPKETPKKRYLKSEEILNVLHTTYAKLPNPPAPCPITKGDVQNG